MIKILLAVAVLVSLGSLAGPAMAQGNRGEAFGSEISSQCAHRRIMAPNLRDGCVPKLPSGVQLGYARGYLGYGRGQFGYGRDQLGYAQGQPGYGQRQPGYEQGEPGHEQAPGDEQGGASARSSDQRDEEQPKAHREQPSISTPPKVAAVPAPKAKKANTPPRLDAQKEQQLYQEFLEWRNRRLFNEYVP